jgi:hypothetical protein
LGSNQRRLSRRFYSTLAPVPPHSHLAAETPPGRVCRADAVRYMSVRGGCFVARRADSHGQRPHKPLSWANRSDACLVNDAEPSTAEARVEPVPSGGVAMSGHSGLGLRCCQHCVSTGGVSSRRELRDTGGGESSEQVLEIHLGRLVAVRLGAQRRYRGAGTGRVGRAGSRPDRRP